MRHTTRKWLALALALAVLLALAACGGGNAGENDAAGSQQAQNAGSQNTGGQDEDTQENAQEGAEGPVLEGQMALDYAEKFTIDLYSGGYRVINIEGAAAPYLVVPEGAAVPETLAEGATVLQLPIERAYVASTSMMSLLDAIGGLDQVKLVATEQEKWYLENIVSRMEAGDMAYSGAYDEPDYELMTAGDIQFHLDSGMVDGHPEVLEKFAELGIPSLVERSSQEGHPLARVEWVKVLGVLFGLEEEAQRYFEEQKALVEGAAGADTGRTASMGYITSSGKCYARNGGDYMAQMIALAGGEYILADMAPEESGNTNMTFEDWYAGNKDADYLFYVNFAMSFDSLQAMIDYNPLFADFKAVQEGHVYVTSPDFTQSTAAIASIIADMNTIFTSDDPEVTTDHLIRLS